MKRKYFKYLLITLILSMPVTLVSAIEKKSCGYSNSNYLKEFPAKFPKLTSNAFFILEVAVPVLIIVLGTIDLIKAVTAGKEDEIKKAQGVIVKRIITGAIVFFVFAFVKLLVRIVDNNSNGIINCMNCFINYNCSYVKVK